MARTRMVTRTITTQEATVLKLNIVTAEPSNETYTVPCNIKEGEPMLKYLKKNFDTDTEKIVSITDINKKEELYGMPETEFVAKAKVITKAEAEKDGDN